MIKFWKYTEMILIKTGAPFFFHKVFVWMVSLNLNYQKACLINLNYEIIKHQFIQISHDGFN